jgi:hypothetical protein
MKALQFSTYGTPAVLTLKEIPAPEPRKGEALVKIRATDVYKHPRLQLGHLNVQLRPVKLWRKAANQHGTF